MTAIKQLRRDIIRDYAASVGLPANANYISGASLRPVVPLDTGSEVFIIGAYPSARFGSLNGERDVPMADNLGPFEPERYFDGERVRVQNSAAELQEHFLTPLGLSRDKCWVTDLVKVFLFKKGHREKYDRLDALVPAGYRREDFETLGQKSLPWIERELRIASPSLVVTLGSEVAGILTRTPSLAGRTKLLSGTVYRVKLGATEVNVAHLPHPGILMRKGAGAEWRTRNKRWVAALADWLRSQDR